MGQEVPGGGNKMETNTKKIDAVATVCDRCGKEATKNEVKYSDTYDMNLCENCERQLAEEMKECDRELATLGEL